VTIQGTVVNGVIVLDGAPQLPEGARVRVELTESAADDSAPPTEGFEYPHPLAPYDRKKEMTLLRESIAAMDAGEKGKSVAEVFDEIDRELNRPANGEG
jgi:hypothetical protein